MSKCMLWQKFWQNNFDKYFDTKRSEKQNIYKLKRIFGVGTTNCAQKILNFDKKYVYELFQLFFFKFLKTYFYSKILRDAKNHFNENERNYFFFKLKKQ